MRKFIAGMLVAFMALAVPMAANAGVGFGYDRVGTVEGLTAAFGVGGKGLRVIGGFEGGGSVAVDSLDVDFSKIQLGAKLMLPIWKMHEGAVGKVQPLFYVGLGADFTNFDFEGLDTLTDWTGEVGLGGEWFPVDALGLTGGAGVEFVFADGDGDDTFKTFGASPVGNLGFIFYFGK